MRTHRQTLARSLLLAVAALSILLAACGEPGGGSAGKGGKSGKDVGHVPAHPTDPSTPIVVLSTGGGFVPASYAWQEYPQFVLYGDGRVVVRDSETGVPMTGTVDVDALYRDFAEAGLFRKIPEWEPPGVTDNPSTTLTVETDESDVELSIYAYEFAVREGRLPRAVRASVEAVREAKPEGLWPWQPDQVRVHAQVATVRDGEPAPAEFTPAVDLAKIAAENTGSVVEGNDAAALWEWVLAHRDDTTLLVSTSAAQGGTTYRLSVAPVLPGIPDAD